MDNVVYFGKSGCGINTIAFNDIKKFNEEGNSCYVVVPPQYKAETEKQLLKIYEEGYINLDVVDFNKIGEIVFNEVGGHGKTIIDDNSKLMIIKNIAIKNKAKLPIMGSLLEKNGTLEEIRNMLTEFIECNISVDELEASDDEKDYFYNKKIEDIKIIYKEYLKELSKKKYITIEQISTEIIGKIGNSNKLKNSIFLFTGFNTFTSNQLHIIQQVSQIAQKIIFTFYGNESLLKYIEKDDFSKAFQLTKSTIKNIKKYVSSLSFQYIPLTENSRYGAATDLRFLSENFLQRTDNKYERKSENIKIIAGKTYGNEIEFVVNEILQLVTKEGYLFRDIALMAVSLDNYKTEITDIFAKNNIPFYFDANDKISMNAPIEFIKAYINLMEKGTITALLDFISCGFIDFLGEDYINDRDFENLSTDKMIFHKRNVDILENYIDQCGIKYISSLEDSVLKKGKLLDRLSEDEKFEIDAIREKVYEIYTNLKDSWKRAKTTKEKVIALYNDILLGFDVNKRINKEIENFEALYNKTGKTIYPKLIKEYKQIYRKIIDLLDNIVYILGKEKLSTEEFNEIVVSGLDGTKISTVPPTRDMVIVGEISRTRLSEIKVMFFVGLNEGIVEKLTNSKGLLTKADKEILSQSLNKRGGLKNLKPFGDMEIAKERLLLYNSITKAREKLYISYAIGDIKGTSFNPSNIIDELIENFKYKNKINIDIISDFSLPYIYNRERPRSYEKKLNEKITEKLAKELYGDISNKGISRFESFASCPFMYFLNYGLKLEENKKIEYTPSIYGQIIHKSLENIFNEIIKEKHRLIRDKKLKGSLLKYEILSFVNSNINNNSNWINDIVDNAISEYSYIFDYNGKNKMFEKIIKDVISKNMNIFKKQIEYGQFLPEYVEFTIKDEGGKIDRVDINNEKDNKHYLRIVDYKQSNHTIEFEDIYSGINMQLLYYMTQIIKQYKKDTKILTGNEVEVFVAEILYSTIKKTVVSNEGRNIKELESEILKKNRMDGLFNTDCDDVIFGGTKEENKIVDYSLKTRKDKKITNTNIDQIGDFIEKKRKKQIKEIIGGESKVYPYKKENRTACDFCQYSGICNFDKSEDDFNIIRKITSDELFKLIEREGREND